MEPMKKKYKITIVDNTEGRRINFNSIINNIVEEDALRSEFEVFPYKHVWGNGERPSTMKFIEQGDILFIHANDEVNPLWNNLIKEKCKDVFVICFSGAGVRSLSLNNPKHLACYKTINTDEDIRNKWHLKDFFLSIKNEESNPFDKLMGFDLILEAKLELLHKCLLPSDAPILKEFQSDFIILDNFEIEYKAFLYKKMFLKKEGKKANYEVKEDYIFQESFKDNAFEATDDDVFHPDYIEALKQLRIALLGS
jgi:hypothetical protein